MLNINQAQIWYYPEAVDFRKQIDGLMILVASQMKADPTNGNLFIFRNKQKDKIKVLYYDRNGFCVLYKRLEQGRFKFNVSTDKKIDLTKEQLSFLIAGLDYNRIPKVKEVKASCFY